MFLRKASAPRALSSMPSCVGTAVSREPRESNLLPARVLTTRQLRLRVMQALGLLLAVLLTSYVHAQRVVPPPSEGETRVGECWPNCGDGPTVVQGSPLPPCWPSNFGGTGTLLYSGITEKGNWHGWWCPVNGRWQGVGVVTSNDWLVRHPREPRTTLAEMAAAYWALNVFEPASSDLKAVQAEMWATLDKYPPQDPLPRPPPTTQEALRAELWTVAPSGVSTSPTYRVVDGKLQTAKARAVVGQPCDCHTRKFTDADGTWCAPPGQPNLVTLCSKSR